MILAVADGVVAQEKETLKVRKKEMVTDDLPETSDRFYPDLQSDDDMKLISEGKSWNNTGIQFGGWFTPTIITQDEETGNLTTSVNTVKIWAKSYLWQNSFIYLRVKETLLGVAHQSGGNNLDEIDNLIDLDVGFIGMSFLDNTIEIYLGRKYFIMGSGLIFNGRADGIELDYYSRYASLKFFCAYTGLLLKDNNPYGMSARDISDGAKRLFVGGSVSTDFDNQTMYLIGMGQIDFGGNEEYNSQYYAVGMKGVLFQDLSYFGELIAERGQSYSTNSLLTGDRYVEINSYAANAGLNYYFHTYLKPAFIAQYAFGSGDKDRDSYRSVTHESLVGDDGFIGFGTFNGGFALKPLPGNLHVIRAGFSIAPCSWAKRLWLKRMTVISKYTVYLKDEKDAAVKYGDDAEQSDYFVGQGVDFAFRWKIFSDLSVFTNYAFFVPGSAYPESENVRHFFMTGCNLSF